MKHFRILGLLLGLLIGATPSYAIVKSLGGGSGGGGGSGTVTSVGLTAPSVFSVSGSPVTTAGTIGVTFATGQTQNQFLATPDGASGAIGLRSIVAGDLPAGVPTAAANPTGTIGLTAVNGVATTFLRSDGAPALSQAIVPTWTGTHTFSAQIIDTVNAGSGSAAGILASSAQPTYGWSETDQATDAKNWDIVLNNSTMTYRIGNDANSVFSNYLQVARSVSSITSLSFGNAVANPTFNFLGNGTLTATGSVTAGGFSPSSAFASGTRINLSAANTLGFVSNNVLRGNFDANGQFNIFGAATASSGIFSQLTASATPIWAIERTGSATDAKYWTVDASGSNGLTFNTLNDAFSVSRSFFATTRSGVAVTDISLGNATDNNTFTLLGTGTLTIGGSTTLTGTANFSNVLRQTNINPEFRWTESDQGTDLKVWDQLLNGGVMTFSTLTDANAAGKNWLTVTRGPTTAIASLALGNATDNPTYTFLGTGSITAGANAPISAGRFVVTGSGVPSNGTYLAGTNLLGFAANTSAIGTWNTSILDAFTDVAVDTVGKGLQVKEGTNAKQGTCTLAAGTCTVSDTAVTATSRIFLTEQTLGTITVPSALAVSARTAGTSFTILASALTDTSVVAYEIFEPAP